eukprot:gene6286-12730_t
MSLGQTVAQQEEVSMSDVLAKDAEEVFEFLKLKGPALEGFKREYIELQGLVENLQDSITQKERDVEAQVAELTQVRDQLSNSRKAIEESQLQKENLQVNIDHVQINRRNLIDKEVSNRSEINVYSGKFEELKAALALGSGWTPEQEEEKENYEKTRDFLTKKLENKMNLVQNVRSDVDKLYELIQEVESQIAEIDSKIENTNNEIKQHNKKASEQKVLGETLESKIKELQQAIVIAETNLAEKSRVHQGDDKTLIELETNLSASKQRMEEYLREYDGLVRITSDLTLELDRIQSANVKINDELLEREKYISERNNEISSLVNEAAKINGLKELAQRKLEEIEKEKHDLDAKKDAIIKKIEQCRDVDLKIVRKECELQTRQEGTLQKEIDILKKKFEGSERSGKTIEDLIHLNRTALKNLGQEKKSITESIEAQQETIQSLLHEKDKHEHEAEATNQQYYTALEELKLQELQIKELQKKIVDDQAKLKQKQNLYEAVRSDRNLYSKQLVDSQEEINALKRRFRLMNHQIEQLKEEISAKDNAIVKEHFHHHTVDKERELLKNELTKIRKQVSSSEQIIENQQIEILKLARIIEEADQERQRQNNELTAVISERNLLTAQVVKRNYELSAMYERIKVQRSNLRIGERHYTRINTALEQWRKQIIALVQEQKAVMADLSVLEDLRNAVFRTEKELLQEKSKSRGLMEELARPMNVHRWRVLESSDPKRYELIRQIQQLQKSLIQKSDEVVRTDLLIQEKEKVYLELKNIIARQPGPEVEEQILVYQQTLKDKTKQLAAMDEELDMYRQQVQSFKEEITMLDADMGTLKKKWLKTRKTTQDY